MRGTLIVAILLSVLLTIFALANNEMTEINYLFGVVDIPKALLIMCSLTLGALIMFLFNIPSWWKNRQQKGLLKKEITKLKKENKTLTETQIIETIEPNDEFINDVDNE